MSTLDNAKEEMRAHMRGLLAAVVDDVKQRSAALIVDPILTLVESGPVALFASMGNEIDTGSLDDALRVRSVSRALPQVIGRSLVFRVLPVSVRARDLPRAAYGAPAPSVDFPIIPLSSCVLVVVPGLAFDRHGNRLGYGRGFYDRALADLDRERCVGLLFDEQLVDAVPAGPLDVRLRHLCTPSRGVFRSVS